MQQGGVELWMIDNHRGVDFISSNASLQKATLVVQAEYMVGIERTERKVGDDR